MGTFIQIKYVIRDRIYYECQGFNIVSTDLYGVLRIVNILLRSFIHNSKYNVLKIEDVLDTKYVIIN